MQRAPSQSSRTATGRVRRPGQPPRRHSKPAPFDLDALSAHWRKAFNAAQDALAAASLELPPTELRERRYELERERAATAQLVETVATEEHLSVIHHLGAPRPSHRMLGLASGVLACVFDLEGVLTASAEIHAAAWADSFEPFLLTQSERTGERYGPYTSFDPDTDYRMYLHGRPRLDGVRTFLAARGIRLPEGDPDDLPSAETVHGLANGKRQALLHRLDAQGVAAFETTGRYLDAVRDAGLRCAVVSASANTHTIIDRAGLAPLIDECVDGNMIVAGRLRAWPHPDVLLAACRLLDVQPQQAAVFETEPAGAAGGQKAGFAQVVGVDRSGQPVLLRESGADVVIAGLAELLDPALVV
jgi:beta-phosphoglucomutase-like phosphatase (HAD superfamily)